MIPGPTTRLSPKRNLTALVMLYVLLLQALVPAGFMWVASDTGLRLEFCPGQGAVTTTQNPHDYHQYGDESLPQASADATCAYALAFAPMLPAAAFSRPERPAGFSLRVITLTSPGLPDSLLGSLSARGPPHYS